MNKYELEINDENLRETIKNNILERNSKLVILSKLLANSKDNLTIFIDGQWGSGKTFFIRQFKYLVEKIDEPIFIKNNNSVFKQLHENSVIVYYNAWENDMHTNPLESLIYNILNEYPNFKNNLADFNDFKKVFKELFIDTIKSLSNGIFDISKLDNLTSFENLSNEIVTIEEKKKAFNKLIDTLLNENKRLILIIDELDRCKPTYAIELLETIKHFYNNNKITTIVVTNISELSKTIQKLYGSNFNSANYLNKFYDFIMSLDNNDNNLYLKYKFNIDEFGSINDKMHFPIAEYFRFSLRDCNRYMKLYEMSINYTKQDDFFNPNYSIAATILFPIALALKIKNNDKYNSFITGNNKEIIADFFDKKIANTKLLNSFQRKLKSDDLSETKNKILKIYDNIFNTEHSYSEFPFFEALSLLGTKVKIDE